MCMFSVYREREPLLKYPKGPNQESMGTRDPSMKIG